MSRAAQHNFPLWWGDHWHSLQLSLGVMVGLIYKMLLYIILWLHLTLNISHCRNTSNLRRSSLLLLYYHIFTWLLIMCSRSEEHFFIWLRREATSQWPLDAADICRNSAAGLDFRNLSPRTPGDYSLIGRSSVKLKINGAPVLDVGTLNIDECRELSQKIRLRARHTTGLISLIKYNILGFLFSYLFKYLIL